MALQVRNDPPVDPVNLAILSAVKEAAHQLGVPVTLVGATARDILLTHVYGIAIARATADIDLALAIPGWATFHALIRALLGDPRFERANNTPNRLWFRMAPKSFVRPLDIVPYGPGIDGPLFRWPTDTDLEMNIAGYADAARNATTIQLSEDLAFEVVTLPGLFVLKLYAWIDRRRTTSKDAEDLALLLTNYIEAGNLERIYNEDIQALEAVDFDLGRASPRLLGQDAAGICSAETHADVLARLTDETLMAALAIDLSRTRRLDPDAIEKAISQIADFKSGFIWKE